MLVQTLFWIVLPGLCYGLLAAWLVPVEPRHRWRTRRWRRRPAANRLGSRRPAPDRPAPRDPGAPSDRRPPTPPDPFAVLTVQVRLGILTAQLQSLENDAQVWARARRLEATRAAYDDLLADACRLAGVPVPDEVTDRRVRRREEGRFAAEMELTARGWSW